MGRMILDTDEVPPGCVMHMRLVQPEDTQPENDDQDTTSERDASEAAEILYDSDVEVEDILGADWNDPEVIAEYRARLEERGIDPEEAQKYLEKTLKTIKKYQHYVFFFIVALIMELFVSPPLSHRIKDSGNNPLNNENLTGFAWFYSICDYINMLTIWWVITLVMALIILVRTCMGNQSERLLRFYRFQQYVFLAFNVYFIIASGLNLEPFKTMIEKGVWVSMACTVILVSCFRIARIYVSYGYYRVYKLLKPEERQFAHTQ